jgi:predicted nucleotidyltransferase
MKIIKRNNFGDELKKLRLNKKLPLRIVSAYLDIDQAILSKIERGQRRATREQVVKLSPYYKVKEEDLLVSWLSDKLIYELTEEKLALKVLQLTEERVKYASGKKIKFDDVKNKFKNYFIKNGRISKAWIFGSFARGDYDQKSDIDIMIEVPKNKTFTLLDLAEIKYQLEKIVPVKIDLVMKDGINPQIMSRIKSDLKVIYER